MFESKNSFRDRIALHDLIMEKTGGNPPCQNFPDAFNANKDEIHLATYAKSLCAECPVKRACAEYAIKHESEGFWGGLTARERKSLRAKGQETSLAV